MRDRLRFGRRVFAQDFGRPGMQPLAAALEEAVVGRVLDQRVFEAISSLRRSALDKQQVGFGKPLQRGLKSGFVKARHITQQRIDEIASENRANLCDLTRRP